VRDEWRVILIWADALCIKQEGASEKKAQVNKMGLVYSSASHTVIYLDESGRDLDSLLLEYESLSVSNPNGQSV
jgi:hypothetical protein